MIAVGLGGIGLCGPGMGDWPEGKAVLRGERPWTDLPPQPAPAILPPAERRRCGHATRLALQVAQEAVAGSGTLPGEAATVFASAEGDGENLHRILESLAESRGEVSPTRFHNSVHNAAAGYWNIAAGARTPSTSIAAGDGSFAAGLAEAAAQVTAEGVAVLLVAFDLPLPPPLHAVRPLTGPFAAALLLTPPRAGATRLILTLGPPGSDTTLDAPALEALRRGNPAARALPLLQALALGTRTSIALPWGENGLEVTIDAG